MRSDLVPNLVFKNLVLLQASDGMAETYSQSEWQTCSFLDFEAQSYRARNLERLLEIQNSCAGGVEREPQDFQDIKLWT